jgi:hypothetical protein
VEAKSSGLTVQVAGDERTGIFRASFYKKVILEMQEIDFEI